MRNGPSAACCPPGTPDESPWIGVSERVLAAAKDLASLSKAEVWVLHLREHEHCRPGGLVATESDNDAAAGFVLGSTAHKVIHLTDRPVLVVR